MAWEKENRALNPLRAFSHLPCYFLRCIFLVCLELNGGQCPTLPSLLPPSLPLRLWHYHAMPAPGGECTLPDAKGFSCCCLPFCFFFFHFSRNTLCFPSSSSSVYVLCLRFCFCFFSLSVFLISHCGQTRRRISFSTCCSYATDNRISFCLPFKFWSTPLKTVQITPERLFASWVRIPRELKAVWTKSRNTNF